MIVSTLLSVLLSFSVAAASPQQDTFEEQVEEYKALIKDRDHEHDASEMIDGFISKSAEHRERLVEMADMLEVEEGDAKALRKEIKTVKKEQEEKLRKELRNIISNDINEFLKKPYRKQGSIQKMK